MITKELMANDWVFDGSINIQLTPENIFDIYVGNWDEPKPIPLTEEMLKINGFEDAGGYMTRVDNMKIVEICLMSNIPMYVKTEWTYCFPHPQYVHELQHILRLCGLNDLANNFKIQE